MDIKNGNINILSKYNFFWVKNIKIIKKLKQELKIETKIGTKKNKNC